MFIVTVDLHVHCATSLLFFGPLLKKLLFFKLQPQPGVRGRQPPAPAPNRQPATTTQSEPEEPPSPTSSTSSRDQKEMAEVLAQSPKPKTASQAAGSNTQKAPAAPESSIQSTPIEEVEAMQTEAVASSSATENTNPPPRSTVIEESIRVTRAGLRKTRSAAAASR